MSNLYQRLSHSRWDCKYHVVFIPKRRRKVLFGRVRQHLGEVLPCFGPAEGMADSRRTSEAGPCAYVHSDSSEVPGGFGDRFLKGKSAIAVARLCGRERNFTGKHLWARGYAVSTVGFEREQIRQYIRDQEEADKAGRF